MIKIYHIIRRLAYSCALVGIVLTVLGRMEVWTDPRVLQAGFILIILTFCLFFLSYGLIVAIRLRH